MLIHYIDTYYVDAGKRCEKIIWPPIRSFVFYEGVREFFNQLVKSSIVIFHCSSLILPERNLWTRRMWSLRHRNLATLGTIISSLLVWVDLRSKKTFWISGPTLAMNSFAKSLNVSWSFTMETLILKDWWAG